MHAQAYRSISFVLRCNMQENVAAEKLIFNFLKPDAFLASLVCIALFVTCVTEFIYAQYIPNAEQVSNLVHCTQI